MVNFNIDQLHLVASPTSNIKQLQGVLRGQIEKQKRVQFELNTTFNNKERRQQLHHANVFNKASVGSLRKYYNFVALKSVPFEYADILLSEVTPNEDVRRLRTANPVQFSQQLHMMKRGRSDTFQI